MTNPTPPKIQLSPEEFAQVNEGAATSLTQDWSPVDQGLAGQIAEREQLLRAQPLEMAIADDKRSTWDTWQAGLQETETAYLLRAYLEDRDEMFPRHDPNFDIKREYGDIIRAHGIQDNDNNLTALSKATSSEEASWLATSIADKEARKAVLAQHGVIAFTTGMVDPLTILADMATYGGTRVLKMGRLSSAIAGGSSAVAVSAMADYAGKDYEALDYAINFGVTAGAFALVGGRGLDGLRTQVGTPGVPGDTSSRLTDFLSETDKLISPSAESAALLANVVDDPVRRAGILTNDNAASTFRVNSNVLDGTFAKWTESLEKVVAQREGIGTFSIKMDASGRYGEARQHHL